jgi:hypothetical protein
MKKKLTNQLFTSLYSTPLNSLKINSERERKRKKWGR